jgi:hypothetical protein
MIAPSYLARLATALLPLSLLRQGMAFRAKWIPVRVKKTRQNNNLEHDRF